MASSLSTRSASTPLTTAAPATSGASHRPTTEMTSLPESSCDTPIFDVSSATLQDKSPPSKDGINEHIHQRIPSSVVPVLLHASDGNDHPSSPLRRFSFSSFLLDDGLSEDSDSDQDESDANSDSSQLQCSTVESAKQKIATLEEVGNQWYESKSLKFCSTNNSTQDWVMHTTPILHEYADRQASLPLGRRLDVSIDEPSDFILGSLQLLANRDRKDCTDRSRQLGPQLFENFVNINGWAKEYFRSRHGAADVGEDVTTLLTIVLNGFQEGLVELVDRLVEFALQHMHFCGRSRLAVEDFSFGYDFRMSQDLPFYIETSSRIREPVPIRAVQVPSVSEPVTTCSGRQVKPTNRAQAVSEQITVSERQNKGKGLPQVVKGRRVPKGAIAPPRQKKALVQPSSNSEADRTTTESSLVASMPTPPPHSHKTTIGPTRHRPLYPSNLGLLPPISPDPSSSERPSEDSASALTPVSLSNFKSTSGDRQSAAGCSESDAAADRSEPCRLKIRIPRRTLWKSMPTSTTEPGAVAESCGLTATTATILNDASGESAARSSALSAANGLMATSAAANGCSVGTANEVPGRSRDDTEHAGGAGLETNALRERIPAEKISNMKKLTGPDKGTRTVQARSNLKEDRSENIVGKDTPIGLSVKPSSVGGAYTGDTGDPPSSFKRPLCINEDGVDTREEDPAFGTVNTKEREPLPRVPPSDPEPFPGSGSGSGCSRGKKRKLDDCED